MQLLTLQQAYVLLREFILGTNKTGLVVPSNASTSAVRPTATLEGMNGDVLRAAPQIYGGAGATQTTILPASATVAAWNRFIATRWSTASRSAGGHSATPGVQV
jgi:carboxypeptidase D